MEPRILGLDYGTKRVGLAIADPLRLFAQPLGTFSPEEALAQVDLVAQRDGLAVIVAGWPLELDGTEGRATQRVQQYLNRIAKRWPAVELVKWDERFSSEQARALIRQAGPKRKFRKQKGRLDVAAAALLLQQYLDEIGP